MERKHWELSMLLKAVERKFNDNAHKPAVLKKLAAHIKNAEKPGKETLDRLSLLAGFQDWESFKAAIYGSADGLSNFEEEGEDSEERPHNNPAGR